MLSLPSTKHHGGSLLPLGSQVPLGGKKGSEKSQELAGLRGQVQYLHKALLPQLDGVGGLEEVRAEVEAQLEGEAVHVDALHLFLWEMGGRLGQSGRHPARKVRGGSRSHGPELLPDLHHHLKPPPTQN